MRAKPNEINISNKSRQLLETLIPPNTTGYLGIRPAGPYDDGDWLIELGEATLERLQAAMLPGESYDDIIERAFAMAKGLN